ncbi:MAG: hypothetical protein D6675_13755 [Gemmatimonadetes bacterium]|nr:MAG: hypothetical protein D6675_13755 [Gemmatimonadota bacterium]
MTHKKKSEKVPSKMKARYEEIITLTNTFCAEHLDEEYAQLCRYAAAALARKRPSPLEKGRVKSWACGIAYAMGYVNFLSDSSQDPHMSMGDLCAAFGVSTSTGSTKSKEVREALGGIERLDPAWTVPSQIENNPFAWMVETSEGLILDSRSFPAIIRQALYEEGILPFPPNEEEVIENIMELMTNEPDDELDDTPPRSSAPASRKTSKPKKSNPNKPRCGLGGKQENLTRTPFVGNGFVMMLTNTSYFPTPEIAVTATMTGTPCVPFITMRGTKGTGKIAKSAKPSSIPRCMSGTAQMSIILLCWKIPRNTNPPIAQNVAR